MQNIFDIHDYDEHFLEQFTANIIPVYDLWSIRPLQNEHRELTYGTFEDTDKFREFIAEHANKEYPHPLLIVIGNAEKASSKLISNRTKNYYKIKFDKYKGNDIGTPLQFGNYSNSPEQMQNIPFAGFPQRPQFGGMPAISMNEIQGIVDRNVTDATRSIRAEYEEISAKREVDSIKKLAEFETKFELFKLDNRAKEVEEKEQKLNEQIEAFEQQKLEGFGTVKEYTKTIASGLMEIGKVALGLEDFDFKKKPKTEKIETTKTDLKGTTSTTFDDDGFIETNENSSSDTQFENLIGMIKNLNEEQKFQLLDVLMPEEEVKSEELKVKSDENEEI